MNLNKTKTGGRTKGTPNKITNHLRNKLKAIIDNELLELPKMLNQIDPKERIELLIILLPYTIPKVQTVSHKEGEPLSNWMDEF